MSLPSHAFLVVSKPNPLFANANNPDPGLKVIDIFLDQYGADRAAVSARRKVLGGLNESDNEHFIDRMLDYRKSIRVLKVSMGNPIAQLVADEMQSEDA